MPLKQQEMLSLVGDVEELMVAGFPFSVPAEYSDLPQLLGRADVEARRPAGSSRPSGSRGYFVESP